jgi:hypothetical protein
MRDYVAAELAVAHAVDMLRRTQALTNALASVVEQGAFRWSTFVKRPLPKDADALRVLLEYDEIPTISSEQELGLWLQGWLADNPARLLLAEAIELEATSPDKPTGACVLFDDSEVWIVAEHPSDAMSALAWGSTLWVGNAIGVEGLTLKELSATPDVQSVLRHVPLVLVSAFDGMGYLVGERLYDWCA